MSKKIMSVSDFTGVRTCADYNFVAGIGETLKTSSSTALDRHISMMDVIKRVMIGKFTIGEVNADLLSEGIESNYGLSETDEAMAEKEAALIRRYLNSENADIQAKRIDAYPEVREIDCLNDISVPYAPNTVKIKDNVITSAIYHAGSSQGRINQRTGMVETKKANMEMWFKAFLGMLFAKKYAEECGKFIPGQHVRCVGAHYFMKKTTDKAGMLPDRDFFSGSGNNVITMEMEAVIGAPVQPDEQIQAIHKYMENCLIGFKCSGDDCQYCVSKTICNFQKPPIKQAKKEVKKREKMAPTQEQQTAIDAREGLFKLLATAGSGKTETVTERFVVLVQELMSGGLELKEALSKILMLSFTENAVGELKDRILSKLYALKLYADKTDLKVSTFHAFANAAIGEYYEELGFSSAPKLLDPARNLDKIEKILEANPIVGVDASKVKYTGSSAIPMRITMAETVFAFIKEARVDIDAADAVDTLTDAMREQGIYKNINNPSTVGEFIDAYREYATQLKEDCFVTYSDQEPLMYKVLELHPDYFENMGLIHVMVDEAQDSNEIQIETLKRLRSCASNKSMMLIGDINQAIYGFRNTSPKYMRDLEQYMDEPVQTLTLSTNFRCTQPIVDLANNIVAINPGGEDEKVAEAFCKEGDKPVVCGFYEDKGENSEVEYICQEIKKLVDEGKSVNDIAVLRHNKRDLLKVGTRLTELEIPWIMKTPMNLNDNSRIIAALALADAFYEPEATISYFVYLGAKYNGDIKSLGPEAVSEEILKLKGTFENLVFEEFDEQRRVYHQYLEELRKNVEDELYDYFLELLYDNDDFPTELEFTRIFRKYGSKMERRMGADYEGVVLCTMHSAKGLEFDTVFVSLEKFDSEKLHKDRNADLIEEARRLLFVSLTRAKRHLYVTGNYVAYGSGDERVFDRFLKECFYQNGDEKAYVPIDPNEWLKKKEAKEKRLKARDDAKASKGSKVAGQIALDLKKEKAAKVAKSKKGSGVRSRSMTAEEVAAYNKLTAGSTQMSLFQFVN